MKRGIIIAGPCAAETREQVMATATALRFLQAEGVRVIFRAGVWKPRTMPESFQGVGDEGLQWLREVRRVTGMEVATEVGTPEQAVRASEAGMDYVWTGARTGASPILVQQIADALAQTAHGGSLKGVLVKNPMHDDVALWAGNIRRMERAGVPVTAVHRGCGHRPCWKSAWELKKMMPYVPLLLDPSHMSGDRTQVRSLCQTAARLGYDGLMVEVHVCPAEAWSDAAQQIEPQELPECLYMRQEADDLQWLRQQIDEADDDIWRAIRRRMDVSADIGELKSARQMEVVQPDRFRQVMERRLEWARQNGLSEQTVRRIMEALHEESIRTQEKGRQESNDGQV